MKKISLLLLSISLLVVLGGCQNTSVQKNLESQKTFKSLEEDSKSEEIIIPSTENESDSKPEEFKQNEK